MSGRAQRLSRLQPIATGFVLTEAPVAAPDGGVYFADVRLGGVHQATPAGDLTCVIEHRKGIGGMASHVDGGFVVSGRNVARKALDQSTTVLADRDESAGRFIFNDLTTDHDGRVYVGSFATNQPFDRDAAGRTGALNMIDLDGTIHVLDDDYLAPNGLSFAPDGTYLYAVETGRQALWRYVVETPTTLSDKAQWHDFGGDGPDGMAVADDGSLWVACTGAQAIVVLAPNGTLLERIPVPLPATSLCFGGDDGCTVFVCTGGHGGEDRAGSVFMARSTVAGASLSPARVRTPA